MLTKSDVARINFLKQHGVSQRDTALLLRLDPKMVARYWGAPVKRRRLADCFSWTRCSRCRVVYPGPKFLPSWQCPRCKKATNWKGCWYR